MAQPGSSTPRIQFVELPASDLHASSKFFAEVFGWELTAFGPTYACTMTGDVDLGIQADPSEATRAPLPVIQVEDLVSALTAVQGAGAMLTKAPFSFPGGKRFHFIAPGSICELAVLELDKV